MKHNWNNFFQIFAGFIIYLSDSEIKSSTLFYLFFVFVKADLIKPDTTLAFMLSSRGMQSNKRVFAGSSVLAPTTLKRFFIIHF